MGASGPEILEVFERRISDEKVAKLWGTARVRFDHLTFPHPIRSEDNKIIKQLEKTFASEGCLDEQHGIPAVIDASTFQSALDKTKVVVDSLRIDSGCQPLKLKFPKGIRLECLHGQHRILAARRHLPPEKRWWTVDLYRTDLGDDARQSLREGYGYSSNYDDGIIFRQLRRCQVAADTRGEKRWRAQYHSDTKDRDLTYLLKRPVLLRALDSIIPVKGLWKDFHLGSLDIFLAMKCDELIAHYISLIKKTYSIILKDDSNLMEKADERTVKAIQLRAPGLSKYDFEFIQKGMTSGELFSQIRNVSRREDITSALLSIDYLIPSIYTLVKDLRFLRPAVDAIRCLVPKPAKRTLLETLYFHFEGIGSDPSAIKIQIGEHSYSIYSGEQSQFSLAIRELFLLAIRHFARQAGQREIEYSKFRLAELAQSKGFSSEQIDALLLNNPYQKMVLDLLLRTLPTQKPADRHSKAQALAKDLQNLMSALSSTTGEDPHPWITVAGSGAPISHRCGPAAWVTLTSDNDRDSDDLRHIFFNKMHLRPVDLQRGGEGVSSFFIKQSIYLAFFGVSTELGQSNTWLHTEFQESHRQPSVNKPTQSESAHQQSFVESRPQEDIDMSFVESSPQDVEILVNQTAANIHQQVVKFVESGATISETPYSKDLVNEQARVIADAGKHLSTLQGQHFLWNDCYDTLLITSTTVVVVTSLGSKNNLRIQQGNKYRRVHERTHEKLPFNRLGPNQVAGNLPRKGGSEDTSEEEL